MSKSIGGILVRWAFFGLVIITVRAIASQFSSPDTDALFFLVVVGYAIYVTVATIRWFVRGHHAGWHPGKIALWWLALLVIAVTTPRLVDDDLLTILAFIWFFPACLVSVVMTWTYLSAREQARRASADE